MNIRRIMTSVALFAPLVLGISAQMRHGKCEAASTDQTTIWGKQNIILKEADIFKSIRGKVVTGGKPLAGVLVEVYDNPEGLLRGINEREVMKPKQKRIVACVTGEDGKFSFPKIVTGNYELRLSKAAEWDSTSVYIVVNTTHERGTKRRVSIQMQLSQ